MIFTRGMLVLGVFAFLLLPACQMAPPQPPVTAYFNYNPPSTLPPTYSRMSIGILKPGINQAFLGTSGPVFDQTRLNVDKMLSATEVDLEKIIIAKGFTTAGSYPSFDEMTYSQKESATLILHPQFEVDLQVTNVPFGQSTVTISGTVVLEFQEPLSREKVWVKRLEMEPMTRPATMDLAEYGNQLVPVVSTNSVTALLNTFYPTVMQKMWNQLDPREIMALKHDAERLKAKTTYSGG